MGKIDAWVPKIPRLKNAKVSRFSYRNAAYTNDDIEGVESYDYARDMNVPSLNKTDTEASVLDSGARAQFSSLTKNALNHFFGRVSYNLNKVIDFLSDFLDDFRVQGIETLRRSANFTLGTYADGKKLRIANTHAANTITVTLPSGQTMNGNGTISIPAGRVIDIELIGSTWKDNLTGDLIGNVTGNLTGNVTGNLLGNVVGNVTGKANVRVSLQHGNTFFAKTWDGLAGLYGSGIWTDGENIYYSVGEAQYVLSKATSTWVAKTWAGLTNITRGAIWTDGNTIYYSFGTNQFVLNKATDTWTAKTWAGLNDFQGDRIWTDGNNIYFSSGNTQRVLNKATSTWTAKTWDGLAGLYGSGIWTDGENIYYSDGLAQWVLNKATTTWVAKTWAGLNNFNGSHIWTDGDDIYYSDGLAQWVLNKATATWTAIAWTGLNNFNGNNIWTDGENLYCGSYLQHFVLPATRHNYVDDDKYNSLFGIVTKCNCSTLSDRFVFANE